MALVKKFTDAYLRVTDDVMSRANKKPYTLKYMVDCEVCWLSMGASSCGMPKQLTGEQRACERHTSYGTDTKSLKAKRSKKWRQDLL